MQKNKFTTYILYAIGEIFLVVIGILIAVNINNWNEEQKSRRTEIKYLKNIKQDLLKDLASLDEVIAFRKSKIRSSGLILKVIRGEGEVELVELNNSIRNMLMEYNFVPNNTTFSELVSSGKMNLISNDSIKTLLFDLQEIYSQNDAMIDHEQFDYREYISRPMLQSIKLDIIKEVQKGEKTVDQAGLSYYDFAHLLSSIPYRNGVGIIEMMSQAYIESYNDIQSKSKEVIVMINLEIGKE